MRNKFYVLILFSFFAIVSYAEVNGDDCQELNNIYVELTLIRPYGFVLTLPDGNTGYIPHIDSISITTRYGALVPRTICTTHGQWGDTISLEPLYGEMESDYLCKIWIRGCNISKAFVFHGWCDEYEGIVLSFTRINPPSLILHIEDTITGVVPRVDSMWLTCSAFRAFPEAFITGNAQSGDTIDLAPLIGMTEASYTCWLRIGDCVKSRSFLYYGEAWDYCLEYTDCSVYAEAIENVMEYGITHTESFEDFHVDSIWLTTSKERDSVVLVSYAQPGEPIDVSMLNQNDYTIYIQIGDCVKIGRFYKWGDAVEALSQPTSNTPSATKILRDGKVMIERGGKTFNAIGQIVQ